VLLADGDVTVGGSRTVHTADFLFQGETTDLFHGQLGLLHIRSAGAAVFAEVGGNSIAHLRRDAAALVIDNEANIRIVGVLAAQRILIGLARGSEGQVPADPLPDILSFALQGSFLPDIINTPSVITGPAHANNSLTINHGLTLKQGILFLNGNLLIHGGVKGIGSIIATGSITETGPIDLNTGDNLAFAAGNTLDLRRGR
jgi:hypothetical protein